MRGRSNFGPIFFLLYLIFGAYFINNSFEFIKMPAFISSLNPFLFLIAGVLLVIGGINYLRVRRRYYY